MNYAKQLLTADPYLTSMQLELMINKEIKDNPALIPSNKKMQNLISSFRSSEMIKYNEIDIIKKTKTFKNLDFFQKIVVDKQNTIVLFASEFQMIRATDPLNVQAFGTSVGFGTF